MRRAASVLLVCLLNRGLAAAPAREVRTEICIVGATPAGLAAAIAASRIGHEVIVAERSAHIGGLLANGLGVTDIETRSTIGGIFKEFIGRVRDHYVRKYGPDSQQVKDSSEGYHFEPSVAESILGEMVREHPKIKVLTQHQFDGEIEMSGPRISRVLLKDRKLGDSLAVTARVFLDATYEGDLAAAAKVPYRIGRESREETGEPYAGVFYSYFGTKEIFPDERDGKADSRIQAYNYRLCLTNRPELRRIPDRPTSYDPEEFRSLAADVREGRVTAFGATAMTTAGVFNIIPVPNGKSDTNNHHNALISTDLPEENQPWPEARWEWRDRFAARLRNYTLGLLYFAQNDPGLPDWFRAQARQWGLCRDEYQDNGNFPRQVYVREARRFEGMHTFRAQDAIMQPGEPRTRIAPDSVTAAHYAIDSHALRKREPGKLALDGFLGLGHITRPYTVPYGVMEPRLVENLLAPVAVSATHLGFGTIRMEPCWMALGQAAGVAATLAIELNASVQKITIRALQSRLLDQNQVLVYYRDLRGDEPYFKAMQFFGVHGWFPYWDAEPEKPVLRGEAVEWLASAGIIATDRSRPLETLDWNVLEQWLGEKLPSGERPYVLRHELATTMWQRQTPTNTAE
jgi:FAD-dependent oxidoreductase family protein